MATAQLTKADWVKEYSERILAMWQERKCPLGRIDEDYIKELETDLSKLFDDPLKRSLIEATY